MAIWRCASGGYHSGNDCYEDFGKYMRHTQVKRDVELVRLPSVEELETDTGLGRNEIEMVLRSLVALTPTTKAGWERLHKGEKK